jgi:mono/diheme cytochrome c family protein
MIRLENSWIRLIKDGEMRQTVYWVTLAFILAFLRVEPGHTEISGKSEISDASPLSREQLKQGKALYEGLARCIHCHGQTALRRPLTKQELFSVIKFGVPGTSHMPFRYLLSDEEIWAIVQYQLHDTCMNGCQN